MRSLLLLFCLLASVLCLSSCVTPGLAISADPPGICVQIPVVPVDICAHLRTTSIVAARKEARQQANQATSGKTGADHPGLRRALRGH